MEKFTVIYSGVRTRSELKVVKEVVNGRTVEYINVPYKDDVWLKSRVFM